MLKVVNLQKSEFLCTLIPCQNGIMKSEFLGGTNMPYNDNMRLGHLKTGVLFVLRKENEHGK